MSAEQGVEIEIGSWSIMKTNLTALDSKIFWQLIRSLMVREGNIVMKNLTTQGNEASAKHINIPTEAPQVSPGMSCIRNLPYSILSSIQVDSLNQNAHYFY